MSSLNKQKIRLLLISAIICLTFSCQNIEANNKNEEILNSEIKKTSKDKTNITEKLYKIELSKSTVSFDVISTGCTKAEHFRVITSVITTTRYQLKISRNKRDNCRAMPHLKTIEMTLPMSLQNKEVLIELKNPLAHYSPIIRKP